VSLTVEVKAKPGATVNAAQVFVARGVLDVKNGKDLGAAARTADGLRMTFWFGGAAPSFDKLTPGPLSICTLPITGNMSDSTFMERLQAHTDELEVHCARFELAATPAKQTFVQEVPSMKPLPAP
jgi:hypothetical protein